MEGDGKEKIELNNFNDLDVKERFAKDDKSVSLLESIIGKIGAWQILLCITLAISKIPVAWHHMGIFFLAPKVASTCEFTLEGGEYCPDDCMKYKFDSPIFNNTIIMEWALVCKREWLADFSQTIFMFGTLLGNVIFGVLSDRYGRRKPLLFAVVLQSFTGVVAAYSWDWYMFTFVRFVLAMATGGTMLITLCLTMEIVGIKYRQVFGLLFQIPFIIGNCSLPGIAYFTTRSWADLQFWISIPTVILFGYYWIIPESPRWLIAKGKFHEAAKVLEKIFKTDGISNLSERLSESTIIEPENKANNMLRIFQIPKLCKHTMFLCICFMACGFSYFGVSQYVSHLSGNIFMNVAISAAIQIPGTLSAIPFNQYFGRRKTLFTSFLGSGVFMLAIAAIPSSWENQKLCFAFLSLLGMSVAFPTSYIFAGEIFPTLLRNSGMGICTMVSRIGAMIAPLIAGLGFDIYWLPPFLFGAMPLLAAVVTLLLPETHGKSLSDTILEYEHHNINANK